MCIVLALDFAALVRVLSKFYAVVLVKVLCRPRSFLFLYVNLIALRAMCIDTVLTFLSTHFTGDTPRGPQVALVLVLCRANTYSNSNRLYNNNITHRAICTSTKCQISSLALFTRPIQTPRTLNLDKEATLVDAAAQNSSES